LLTIALACGAVEHRKRIVSQERAIRGKLQDADNVNPIAQRGLIHNDGPYALRLDTTNLSAEESASALINLVESIVPPAQRAK
jgi:hypothetical protein